MRFPMGFWRSLELAARVKLAWFMLELRHTYKQDTQWYTAPY